MRRLPTARQRRLIRRQSAVVRRTGSAASHKRPPSFQSRRLARVTYSSGISGQRDHRRQAAPPPSDAAADRAPCLRDDDPFQLVPAAAQLLGAGPSLSHPSYTQFAPDGFGSDDKQHRPESAVDQHAPQTRNLGRRVPPAAPWTGPRRKLIIPTYFSTFDRVKAAPGSLQGVAAPIAPPFSKGRGFKKKKKENKFNDPAAPAPSAARSQICSTGAGTPPKTNFETDCKERSDSFCRTLEFLLRKWASLISRKCEKATGVTAGGQETGGKGLGEFLFFFFSLLLFVVSRKRRK